MKIKSKTMLGVSLLTMTFSFEATAQTCKPVPTCAELGYTETSCSGDSLKCPFDTTKLYCVPQGGGDCDIGSFYYADNTCSRIPKTNKKAIGVVFDPINRIAISYRNDDIDRNTSSSYYWSDNASTIDIPTLKNYTSKDEALTDMNGKANTDAIVTYGKQKGYTYQAAKYCYDMTLGNKKWYLPSAGEAAIFGRICPIIEAISVLGDPTSGDIIWTCYSGGSSYVATSTEYNASSVWMLKLTPNTNTYKWFNSDLTTQNKRSGFRIKCIFKY